MDIKKFLYENYLPDEKHRFWPYLFLSLSILSCTLGIFISETFFYLSLAAVLFTWKKLNISITRPIPIIFYPTVGFIFWSLVSVASSSDPMLSLANQKKLILFLFIPAIIFLYDRVSQCKATHLGLFITVGISSIVALVQFTHYKNPSHRIHGLMGHHMTFSGQLTLVVLCLCIFLLIEKKYSRKQKLLLATLLSVEFIALLLTLTRNSWLGIFCGLLVLFLFVKPRLAPLVPVGALLIFLISPSVVKDRFEHLFDTSDPGNAARIDMLKTGIRMVKDRPLVGVGPRMIDHNLRKYGADPKILPCFYQHLHNNIIQLAAERGLPALFFWLWFMGQIFIDNALFFALLRKKGKEELLFFPLSAIICVVGLFVSGLFEFNFGDSEVLILFLSIISMAYFVILKEGKSLDVIS